MGLAARVIWISQSISGGNTIESWTLRGRETVLESHAGKVGHANAVRLKSTASRTPSRMESRVRGNVQARFGEGCDPFSRNLEQSKGMGAKGSMRTFENLLGVWVRTSVQLPPSGCMRDGSTLMLSPDTRRHGSRQGCTAGKHRARLWKPVSHVTMGRYTNVLRNRRQNRPAKAG